MSKRSSRARRAAYEDRRDNHADRRAMEHARKSRLSGMRYGVDAAARTDSGSLPEMRDGVMHSGYSPSQVYSRRNNAVSLEKSSVTNPQLYGARYDTYVTLRDARKVERRAEAEALRQAARAEAAREQAERAKREGSGWA